MNFHHRRAAITVTVAVLWFAAFVIAFWPWSLITVAVVPIVWKGIRDGKRNRAG